MEANSVLTYLLYIREIRKTSFINSRLTMKAADTIVSCIDVTVNENCCNFFFAETIYIFKTETVDKFVYLNQYL